MLESAVVGRDARRAVQLAPIDQCDDRSGDWSGVLER